VFLKRVPTFWFLAPLLLNPGDGPALLKDNCGRLIDFLSQISKLSYFNLFDLADFLMHAWIASFLFRCLMWQTWVCANTTAHLCLQHVYRF